MFTRHPLALNPVMSKDKQRGDCAEGKCRGRVGNSVERRRAGLVGGRLCPEKFRVIRTESDGCGGSVLDDKTDSPLHTLPSWPRALRVLAVCFVLWLTPMFLTGATQGWSGLLFHESVFFSKAAVVTFGGAYAARRALLILIRVRIELQKGIDGLNAIRLAGS